MKTFPLKLPDELHKILKKEAVDLNLPLHDYIIMCLRGDFANK